MPRIFISFRKADSRVTRARVYEALEARFGSARLFKSGESIQPGTDFAATLLREAAACEVMLVLIGPAWLDPTDQDGQRLIDRPSDWVRVEIATALRKGNLLIPVLLGDATSLPGPAQLPADIAALSGRQFVRIPDSNVDAGLDELISKLTALLPSLAAADTGRGHPVDAGSAAEHSAGARGQVALASNRSAAINAGGDVRGVKVVGGDDRSRTVNKKGVNAAGAAAAGASGGIGSWLLAGKRLAQVNSWARSHKLFTGLILLTVGALTAGAVMIPNGSRTAAGQPTDHPVIGSSPVAAPAVSPTPTLAPLASGAQVTTADNPLGSWADGSLLTVLTSSGSPGTSATINAYDIRSGQALASYQPATLHDPEDGCVIGLYRRPDGSSILLLEYDLVTPAQGIVAGSQVEQFVAVDAATGGTLWSSPLPPYGTPPGANDQSIQNCTNAVGATTSDRPDLTTDGSYLLWSGYLVDLATGKIVQSKNGYQALGRWIAITVADGSGPNGAASEVDLTDPGTGAVQGRITDSEALDVLTGYGGKDNSYAVTPDGATFLAIEFVHGVRRLEALDLPSGRPLWSRSLTTGDEDSVAVDPDTGAGFLTGGDGLGAVSEVASFQPRSGAPGPWSIEAEFCGASKGHAYVVANSELAVLDESQGSQISYDPATSICPRVLDGVVIKGSDYLTP